MSNHTPGPWYYRKKALRGYVVNDERNENEILPTEANARLISAAPDLLAACKRILEDEHCDWVTNGGLQLAIAAIEKAEGVK